MRQQGLRNPTGIEPIGCLQNMLINLVPAKIILASCQAEIWIQCNHVQIQCPYSLE